MRKCNWFELARLFLVNLFHRVLLDRFQYCHVRDVRTGIVQLREGPGRIWLGCFGEVDGSVQQKTILCEDEYIVVHNSFCKEIGDVVEGERCS